jgi:hypothetical protein
MKTECIAAQLEFQGLGRRRVEGGFDGGHLSSDAGALLLRELDQRLRVTERFAACFTDYRDASLIEHQVVELLRQRVYGIALGYEDLNDHDDLLRDPLLALSVGKTDVEGERRRRPSDKGKALASSSTLNRLELTPANADGAHRYKKVLYHPELIENFLVDVFLDSYAVPPEEIILDFDATDDPVHGNQEGRFYHGYYGCYCYMPLYVTCGEHLLVAQLREANQDASAGSADVLARLVQRIRARWPSVRIILRADSGFARDAIMTWCEQQSAEQQVYYVLGMAKNKRLLKKIGNELIAAFARHIQTSAAARVFGNFQYRTEKSWSRARRVVGKAEWLSKGANPRFIVTNLPEDYARPQDLYEKTYCARGEMENRIKEQQLDLFSDRTSAHIMRANQLRLWFSSVAYVLVSAMRRIALSDTRLAKATCGTIRLKLFKIGALIKVSVRRFLIQMASACPYQDVFVQVLNNIRAYPLKP